MKSLVLGFCSVALAACNTAAVSHMMEFRGSQQVHFKAPDGQTYRIFDKPSESRLMITPSLDKAFGAGVVYGNTVGMVDASGAGNQYRDAAAAFLRSSGRPCQPIETTLIAKPQWEVRYQCQVAPSLPAPMASAKK